MLAVLLFHLDLLELGFLGVDVFFVISGFVVYASISKAIAQDRFSLRDFWKRRFLRLFPSLLVTVASTIAIGFFLMNVIARETTNKTGFFSLIGLSNVYTQLVSTNYFAPSSYSNALLHTWSLSVEAQFYLIFPLLIVFAIMVGLRRKTNLILALLGLFSLLLFWSANFFEDVWLLGALTGYYSPLPRIWQFLLGALVFNLLSHREGKSRLPRNELFQSSLVMAFPVLMIFGSDFLNRETATTLLTFLTAGILLHFGRNRNSLVLNSPLLGYVGDRSYSIYLIHWPIIVFLGLINVSGAGLVLLSVIITFFLAHVSHKLLEKPFMSKSETTAHAKRQLRFTGYASSITLILFVTFASWWILKFDSDGVFSEALRKPGNYSQGCHDGIGVCSFPVQDKDELQASLQQTRSNEKPQIVLIGDSNGAQYFDGFLAASSNLDLKFATMTASGCPSFQIDDIINSKSCENYRLNLYSFLSNAPPSIVFVGFSTHYLADITSTNLWKESAQRLKSHVLDITEMGHEVVIFEPLPKMADFDLASVSPIFPNDVVHLQIQRNSEEQLMLQQPEELLGLVELKGRPVSTLRPWSEICTASSCLLFDGTSFNFRDPRHLSVEFSKKFTHRLEDFLLDKLR